jgi:FixJ family two-component response regulator
MSDDLVVVIDDDVSVRRALGNLLDSVGLTHLACAAPEDLSEADLAGRPACLVLDVRMPGCNGLDFHEAFAARHPEVPVIFITGHGDVPMSVRAMKAGAIEFHQAFPRTGSARRDLRRARPIAPAPRARGRAR